MTRPHAMHLALIDDEEHWRARAEEARTVGETMHDPASRLTMEGIARGYDRMAEQAAGRARTIIWYEPQRSADGGAAA